LSFAATANTPTHEDKSQRAAPTAHQKTRHSHPPKAMTDTLTPQRQRHSVCSGDATFFGILGTSKNGLLHE